MKPDPLNLAEQLSHALFDQYRDADQRCLALARCLRVIAASIDHTDGFEPLTSAASDIEAGARTNIEDAAIEAANAELVWHDVKRRYA